MDTPASGEGIRYRFGLDLQQEYQGYYGPFGELSFDAAACMVAGIEARLRESVGDAGSFDPATRQEELRQTVHRLREAGAFTIVIGEAGAEEQEFRYSLPSANEI